MSTWGSTVNLGNLIGRQNAPDKKNTNQQDDQQRRKNELNTLKIKITAQAKRFAPGSSFQNQQKYNFLQELLSQINKMDEKKINIEKIHEIEKRFNLTKDADDNIDKIVSELLKNSNIKNIAYQHGLKKLKGDISPQLSFFADKSSDIITILERVVNEIVSDKIKIRELESEKNNLEGSMTSLKNTFENIKSGYKTILDENRNLYKLNQEVISENENMKTEVIDKSNIAQQYEDITKDIITKKKFTEKKIENMTNMLNKINYSLEDELKNLSPDIDQASLEQIIDSFGIDGGGVSNLKRETSIMKKLNISNKDILYAIGYFYNKELKKKNELYSLLNILDIEYTTKESMKSLTSLLLKRFKKLSKQDIEYLKQKDF